MWYVIIARQRGPLGLETSIWACLTASNHEIHHMSIMLTTLKSPNLSHVDFLDGPAAIQWSRLMFPRTTQDASPNEHMHPEILMENHHKITYSFAWYFLAITPAVLYLLVPV